MIWAAVVGFFLATGGATFVEALGAMLLVSAMKAAADIVLKKNLITGTETPYVIYKESMEAQRAAGADSPAPTRVWIGYAGQMVLWGPVVGLAVYGLLRLIAG